MFEKIETLINGNQKLVILESRSAYGHDKKWVSNKKNNEFKFPVIYSIKKKNEISLKYSNKNKKGHFGISKVIFGSGATGYIIDECGEYGLTQWAVGVVDDKKNLLKIKKALESNEFKEIVKAISVSKAEINRKVLKFFNKDFYKELRNDEI